jgi:hypothetical protein
MFPSISQSVFIRFSICSSIPNMFPIMSSSCVAPHLIPLISNSNLVIRIGTGARQSWTVCPASGEASFVRLQGTDGQSNSISPPMQNFHVRPTKRADLREASFGRLHSCFTICNDQAWIVVIKCPSQRFHILSNL